MMEKDSKIYLAGHVGLVGSAIMRRLKADGYSNILTRELHEMDLRRQADVNKFFEDQHPDYVILAAAKVGGIVANNMYPAEFIADNLMIEVNVIDAAFRSGVRKLEFLGSSCIYPKLAPQPLKEEYLLTGLLEPTNEWYALAKIAGIKMCQAYHHQYGFRAISLMPTNLFGPGDNFDLTSSHVIPALIRKFHEAKVSGSPEVVVWGTGAPRREFLHVDDLASAAVYLMNHYESDDIINVGTGQDVTISDIASIISQVVGFCGTITYDATKPDGTPRKLLDTTRLTGLGWKPSIPLREGVEQAYMWFVDNIDICRR